MAANNKCGKLRTLKLYNEKLFHATTKRGKNEKNERPALYSVENMCKTLRMTEKKFSIAIKSICRSITTFYFENRFLLHLP